MLKDRKSSCNFRHLFAVVLSAFLFLGSLSASFAKDIVVWVYHDFPPFVIDAENEEGLSYDLIDRFNELAGDDFEFKVEVLNRGRLNHLLQQGEDGIVLWTNNLWFDDPSKSKYLWSPALFRDMAAVISPVNAPVEYENANSLEGMRLTGIRGHRYHAGVDKLVNEAKIIRQDVGTEEQLVRSIASGRSQVSVVADLAARYYVASLGLADKVHFSTTPHSDFDRIILVQKKLVTEFKIISDAMDRLKSDEDWQALLKSYGVQPDES